MARTVLIVDDVAFVRKTLAEILTQARYHVVGEAEDGLQAIEMYTRLKPDVVTMDIVMPHMSGIDATRRILKADKEARVVIVSAMGQVNIVMEAVNVGAPAYLLKPLSAEDVVKTIDRALSDSAPAPGRPSQREAKAQ